MSGVVSGGWAYVWAAYIISAVVLTAFTTRAIVMFRDAARRER